MFGSDGESQDEASQEKMERLLLDNLSSSGEDEVEESPQSPVRKKRLVSVGEVVSAVAFDLCTLNAAFLL